VIRKIDIFPYGVNLFSIVAFFAIKKINQGQEITIDYGWKKSIHVD